MQNLGIEISIGVGFGFGKGFEKKVSDSVSKIFGIEKNIGIGFGKKWYRKKFWIRYQKFLVSEKSFGFGFG